MYDCVIDLQELECFRIWLVYSSVKF